jgi:hypothetical protein
MGVSPGIHFFLVLLRHTKHSLFGAFLIQKAPPFDAFWVKKASPFWCFFDTKSTPF